MEVTALDGYEEPARTSGGKRRHPENVITAFLEIPVPCPARF
jgi:hypothetical protein